MRAVDGVDLVVEQGRTLGLVGESGCGKTVTSLSVMRLIDAPGRIEPGSKILFDGRDLAAADEDELRDVRGNEISMIFQEPMTSLNPVYTVGDQIAEAVRLHQGVGQRAALDRAVDMLKLVGIPSPERRVKDYPHQMSGGMRQRVMIAMALSCNPKLLIADEPTTALDVTIQAQILELLKQVNREFGTATVLITHNLGVVAGMCERVMVMYAGRVVEEGPTDDVFASPKHPYTWSLLQSIPRLDAEAHEALRPIEGMPPDMTNLPEGCAFHPRCPFRIERCIQETPALAWVGDTQRAACWVTQSGTDLGAATPARQGGGTGG